MKSKISLVKNTGYFSFIYIFQCFNNLRIFRYRILSYICSNSVSGPGTLRKVDFFEMELIGILSRLILGKSSTKFTKNSTFVHDSAKLNRVF